MCLSLKQLECRLRSAPALQPEIRRGARPWDAWQAHHRWGCAIEELGRSSRTAGVSEPFGSVKFSRSRDFLHEETVLLRNPERNPFTRTALILPLLYRCMDPPDPRWKAGWTLDLGPQGALVELPKSLPPPTVLALRLRTARGPVDLPARVAWVGEGPGAGGLVIHGLTFPVLAPGPRRALALLLDRQGPRGALRIARTLALTCTRSDGQGPSLTGWTRDISRNGLAVYLSQPVPPRTPLQLTLQTTSGPIAAEAEVVWGESHSSQPPGGPYRHGLRFRHLGPTRALALGLLPAAGV
jgi:hypothetical protein